MPVESGEDHPGPIRADKLTNFPDADAVREAVMLRASSARQGSQMLCLGWSEK